MKNTVEVALGNAVALGAAELPTVTVTTLAGTPQKGMTVTGSGTAVLMGTGTLLFTENGTAVLLAATVVVIDIAPPKAVEAKARGIMAVRASILEGAMEVIAVGWYLLVKTSYRLEAPP